MNNNDINAEPVMLGRWVRMSGRPSFVPTLELIAQSYREQECQRLEDRERGDGNVPRHVLTKILSEESDRFEVSIAGIMGHGRTQRVFRARMACYVRLRDLQFSLPAIGLAMGGRDHTTILSGLRRAETMARAGDRAVEARR